MSTIKVWTSDGNWSEGVDGCDKVHLMQQAFFSECWYLKERYGKEISFDGGCYRGGYYDKDKKTHKQEIIPDNWLQIDNKDINPASHYMRKDFSGLDFKNANFFKMRLTTLRDMAEREKTMSALYNKLIELAKVPEKVNGGYCLFFMFSEE
jgi:hypothetical protein